MTKDALYAGFAIFLAGLILFVVVGALIEMWRKRRVCVAVHPPGPPWPDGLNDWDVCENGYTFGELDAMAAAKKGIPVENQGREA